MRRRSTSLVLIACLVLVTAAVAQEQADVARLLDELPDILEEEGVVVNGKNPGELKGRWLALVGADALKPYSAVYIGDVHSDMLWEDEEKEKPMDEHKLDQEIHERVLARLTKTEALGEVLHRGEPEPDARRGISGSTVRWPLIRATGASGTSRHPGSRDRCSRSCFGTIAPASASLFSTATGSARAWDSKPSAAGHAR